MSDARPSRVLLVEINHDGTVGGSHQALLDLVRRLDRERFEPVVLFYQDNVYVQRLRDIGVRVILWEDVWQREHGTRRRWWHPVQVERLGEAVVRRAALLRRERIDLVHINNSPTYAYTDWLPAARLCRIPIVSHCRGAPYPVDSAAVRRASAWFDGLIAISAYVADVLVAGGIAREAVTQIDDGIDLEVVRGRVTRPRGEVRAELGVPDDTLLAVMAGHLRRWKGQDVVLSALAQLDPSRRRRIHVAFAGGEDRNDPGYTVALRQQVRREQLDQCVSFLGIRSDVPDLMNAADLVLHASTTPEPFGLVVLEAMALGRLIIASSLGGPGQVVSAGSGWTFDPAHPEQLAALLGRVIDEPGLARSMSDGARGRAEAFTIQRTVASVEALYDRVLARRGSAGRHARRASAAESHAPAIAR